MRIAIVVPQLLPGGVETFLFRLGDCLQRRGHSIDIIAVEGEGSWFGIPQAMGIRATSLPIPWHVSRRRHAAIVAQTVAAGDFDVILLNHAKLLQATLGLLPEKTVVVPVIHNDHEDVYRVGLSNADAWNVAVAVSPKVYEQCRSLVTARPVVHIPHGVDLGDAHVRCAREPDDRPFRLCLVGRLDHQQKGVLLLPAILDGCHRQGLDVSLTVIGDGKDGAQLVRQCEALHGGHSVSFLGCLPPGHPVYDRLSASHVLVMPSFYEGFGITPLESMACGCVPVCSRLSGVTDHTIVDGETGILVNSGDVGGFVAAISRLYHDRKLWQSMSRAARERVARECSVDAMGQAYLRLFTDALNGRYPLPKRRAASRSVDASLLGWRECVPSGVKHLLAKVKARLTRGR